MRRTPSCLVLSVLLTLGLAAPALATEPVPTTTAAATAETSRFVPLAPTRLLDTRIGLGAPQAKVAPRSSVVL